MVFAIKNFYILFVVLTITLNRLIVGVPVRSMVLMLLLGAMTALFPNQVAEYFRRHIGLFVFCLALTLVAYTLTLYSGSATNDIFRFISEEIIQLYMTVTCIYLLCVIIGPSYVSTIFIVTVMISGFFAMFQYMDVDIAWQARNVLSGLQTETIAVKTWVASQSRTFGLSYTPVNLGYQAISGLIILLLLCKARLISSTYFHWIAFCAFLIGIAIGLRSYMLGVIICLFIFNFLIPNEAGRKSRNRLYFLTFCCVAALSILWLIQPEARVLSVSDGSAQGRLVLAKLGLELILDRPFGFGWGFDSRDYFWIYWPELSNYPNAAAVYEHGLHNYFLNFLTTYGVLGAFLVFLAFTVSTRQCFLAALIFTPYFVTSLVHNAGPFYGEMYFWFAYAVFLYLYDFNYLGARFPSFGAQYPTIKPHFSRIYQ